MPEVKKYRPNIGAPRTTPNEEPAAERACDFRPVDTGFTKEDAIAEANRCLSCGSSASIAHRDDCMTCFGCELYCPEDAIRVSPIKEVWPRALAPLPKAEA